jgi:hypothetical protein
MIQTIRSATIFSLSGDPPRALHAQDDAQAAYDTARLIDGDTTHPCALEKLSAAGATLRLDAALEEGASMTLALADGQRLAGRIAWARDGEAGLVFDAPVDVIGALARNLAALPAERRAMPRVEIHQTASIRHAGKVELARTRNLAQGGAGLETRAVLVPGDSVQLTLDGLRPLDGSVRWAQAGQAGIAFDAEIPWQVLMPWFRQVQQLAPAPLASQEGEGMIADKHAIRLEAPAQVRSGVQWWNAQVRALTAERVELETRAALLPGAQLWIKLPEIGGGPAAVIERAQGRLLCEFRLPLRPHELGLVTGRALR